MINKDFIFENINPSFPDTKKEKHWKNIRS